MRVAFFFVALSVGLIAIYLYVERHNVPTTDTLPLSESAGPLSKPGEGSSTERTLAEPQANPVAEERIEDWKSQVAIEFEAAADFGVFYREHLSSALMGDSESQFYIYKALATCHLYVHGGKTKEFWLTQANSAPDEKRAQISDQYDRCESLMDDSPDEYYGDDGGALQSWLSQAADGGQPVAQVLWAIGLWNDDAEHSQAKVKALLSEAAFSGHPEALYHISLMYAGKDLKREAAWALLACHRGYDCSPTSEYRSHLCALPRGCTANETTLEVLQANLGEYEFNRAMEVASQIQASISSGDEDGLGLSALAALGVQ